MTDKPGEHGKLAIFCRLNPAPASIDCGLRPAVHSVILPLRVARAARLLVIQPVVNGMRLAGALSACPNGWAPWRAERDPALLAAPRGQRAVHQQDRGQLHAAGRRCERCIGGPAGQ